MTQVRNISKEYDIFIGIDVDKKSFSFTVKDKNMVNSKKIPSDAEQLSNYIKKRYPGKRVLCAYEAGPTGYHLYDYLTEQKYDCLVISPNTLPRPINEKVKNNRIDSLKIMEYLSSGHLHSIRIPTEKYRDLRNLIRTRENYANKRKEARQRIKSLLLFEHLEQLVKENSTNWSKKYIRNLKAIPCSESSRIRLDMLLADLEYARKQLLIILKHLKEFVKKHPDIEKNVEYLESIPGIGFITAVTILGKIGDPSKLKNVREISGFIGLTPIEHSTGDIINRGGITHFGDKKLRSMLIEAAWIAIYKDTELNQFFNRIKNKNHPKGAAQKAIVAVARKLTTRIYSVLKNQRKYVIH